MSSINACPNAASVSLAMHQQATINKQLSLQQCLSSNVQPLVMDTVAHRLHTGIELWKRQSEANYVVTEEYDVRPRSKGGKLF